MFTAESIIKGLVAAFCLYVTVPVVSSQAAAADTLAAAFKHSGSGKSIPANSRKQLIRDRVPRFAPDRILVRFRPGSAASETGKAHRQAGGKPLKAIPAIGVHLVEVPFGTVQQKIARYRANPNVQYAEPDYHRVLIIPDEGNDPGPSAGGVIAGREYFVFWTAWSLPPAMTRWLAVMRRCGGIRMAMASSMPVM